MALKLIKNTQYGIDVEYHKILEININWYNKIATIKVGGFINQELRISGSLPIIMVGDKPTDKIFENNFPFSIDGNNLREAYEYLKTLPEFEGAEGVGKDEKS
jgi:hypothetical protein